MPHRHVLAVTMRFRAPIARANSWVPSREIYATHAPHLRDRRCVHGHVRDRASKDNFQEQARRQFRILQVIWRYRFARNSSREGRPRNNASEDRWAQAP